MRNLLSNNESIDVCEDSTYRIYNYYVTGQEFEFEAYINAGYSQPLINKAIGKGSSYENNSAYFNRLAPYFIFVVCAVISIIMWIFLIICYRAQCCCCDWLHTTEYKRLSWWLAIIFYLGSIACCISGFVYLYRFSRRLYGVTCALERFYYDTMDGQLKTTEPKWVGLNNTNKKMETLVSFIESVMNDSYTYFPPKKINNKDFPDIYLSENYRKI